MNKIFLFFLFFFILTCKSVNNLEPNRETKVLFIGNSLTYYYDMPDMLKEMLSEKGYNFKIEEYTSPGIQLRMHFKNRLSKNENIDEAMKKISFTQAERLILKNDWDYIIIQGGTIPMLIEGVREEVLHDTFLNLKSLINNENVILFETWPNLEEYPKKNCYPIDNYDLYDDCSISMENLEQEVDEIKKYYMLFADKYSLNKTNTCSKFYEVLTKHKEINLYHDYVHPNEYGAFLNACIFYKMLTGKNSSKVKYIGSIEVEKAKILKEVADL